MHSAAEWQTVLWRDVSLRAVLAVEIEFFLSDDREPAPTLAALDAAMREAGLPTHPAQKEHASGQYELALRPTADVTALIAQTEALKQAVQNAFPQASFAAKPYAEREGSGLHIHLHLEDATGRNLFTRAEDGTYSIALRHSLAGLLATVREHLPIFAPHPESRARFVPGNRAPTTISWGPNNRTAALRLPNAPSDHKRIEHRVAGADVDVEPVLAAILAGLHHGLTQKSEPPPAIHGDAAEAQYGAVRLFDAGGA